MEEPAAAGEDGFPTAPPEVLLFTSHSNVTNDSFPDGQEENSRGDKFYLPVGLTVCVYEGTFAVKLHIEESLKRVKIQTAWPSDALWLFVPPPPPLQYLIYCCILGLVSCSVFLRINYELKMVVMLVAVVIYNVVILQTRSSLLDQFSNEPYPTDTLQRYRPEPAVQHP